MALAYPELQAQWRERYRRGKAELLAEAGTGASPRGVRKLLQKLALHTDQTLRQLWQQAGFETGCSLIAVGGYGRGELFPHSDVDVLLLLPEGAELSAAGGDGQSLQQRLEGFISLCWDCGLEIGSSVRSPSECLQEAARDITIQTSLLEARLVAGSRSQYAALLEQLTQQLDARAFFVAKTLEMRQRHTKYEDTPYSLEPNCKESPLSLIHISEPTRH